MAEQIKLDQIETQNSAKKTHRKSYSMEFRLDIIEQAKSSFNLEIARKYQIDEKKSDYGEKMKIRFEPL